MTCFAENNAWVVGIRGVKAAQALPFGVILHTEDGGKTGTTQTAGVALWTVSFAGARR